MLAGVGILALAAGALSAAVPPRGAAVEVLAPRFSPGWQAENVLYPFVILDPKAGRYTMYYSGTSTAQMNESVWDRWMTGWVASKNLRDWTPPEDYRPVLWARRFLEGDVVDPAVLAETFDSVFAVRPWVIAEDRGFRMWYTGWNGESEPIEPGIDRQVRFRIGHAISPDGRRWMKGPGAAGAGAVLGPGAPDSPDAKGAAHPAVLKEDGAYRIWYGGYDGTVWRICHATSADGLSWTKRGVVLDAGYRGANDELGASHPVVFKRKGRYELWYQGRSRSNPQFQILRATSSDGLSWTKTPGAVALHPSPPVRDDEEIHVGSVLVLPGEACLVFFAKQKTRWIPAAFGSVRKRSFHIYMETVEP